MSSSPDDTLAAHLSARSSLIASEKSRRFDAARLASLSPAEARAEKTVRELRARENVDVWEREKALGERELFPGMHFLTSKATIEGTELFKMLKRMPKGALLHAHMDAMCDASFLLSLALSHPCMHISSPSGALPTSSSSPFPISPSSSLPSFLAIPNPFSSPSSIHDPQASSSSPPFKISSTMNIFDAKEYKAGTYVPLNLAREKYPDGEEMFDKQIIGLLTIEAGEVYSEYDTSDKIWEKFGSTFLVSSGLLGYEPIFRSYLGQLFRSLIADGVSYVETRINFLNPTIVAENGQGLGHSDWLRIYEEVVEEVKREVKQAGKEDSFWGAKIIYTTVRFIDNDAVRASMKDCLSLKREFPHLIAGYDLVGHEDSLQPLSYYLPSLLWFQQRQREEGLEIPYIFHAGETLGDGDAVDHNLFDAILLGTKRIGHGFSLSKHPTLMEMVVEKGIAIEVCPISSEILRYTPSILNHPLQTMLNYGVHVALSCDDPQIFGNMGSSYDFYQVLVGSEATGLISLGVLARLSIEHSMMEDDVKKKCLDVWERQWAQFVESI